MYVERIFLNLFLFQILLTVILFKQLMILYLFYVRRANVLEPVLIPDLTDSNSIQTVNDSISFLCT